MLPSYKYISVHEQNFKSLVSHIFNTEQENYRQQCIQDMSHLFCDHLSRKQNTRQIENLISVHCG